MSRKRKATQDASTFYIDQNDIADRDALVVLERVQGTRTIRQTAVVAAPEPAPPPKPDPINCDGLYTMLGEGIDAEHLANADEIIEQYIQAPEGRRKKKNPGEYATAVSIVSPSPYTSDFELLQVHDQVLLDWIEKGHREVALAEMLRLEGWRGVERARCPSCPATREVAPSIRCDDCWSSEALCVECCVHKHHEHPLHRVKVRPHL